MLVAIVRVNMLVNFLAYKADKTVRVGLCGQFVCHHVGMYLVFLKSIIQQRCVAKFFITEIFTENLKQIEHKSIYKVCRAFKLFLELLNLSAHFVLLVRRVLVYVVVVEYVATVLVLELWRAQIFIQFWYSHALHIFYNLFLISFIS